MSNPSVIALLAALSSGAVVFWVAWRRAEQRRQDEFSRLLSQWTEAQRNQPALEMLQREMLNLRDRLSQGLAESARLVSDSQRSLGERLDNAAAVVGRVQTSLGSLQEATQRVFEVGQDVAKLNEILRAPKLRGSLGELVLADLLAQILPQRHYSLQHVFRSGEIVDAVIRIGKLVPVDAKFPLENFRRVMDAGAPTDRAAARRRFLADVRRHIDAIAGKYLRPDEGTFDFALMYIPAENVYYETIIKDEGDESPLMPYAFGKRVIPVSPNSFYAYLQTISLGLRGLEVEAGARDLLARLDRMKGDLSRFRDDFSLIGRHLSNARGKFEDAERRLSRLEDKMSISSDESEAALPAEPGRAEVTQGEP